MASRNRLIMERVKQSGLPAVKSASVLLLALVLAAALPAADEASNSGQGPELVSLRLVPDAPSLFGKGDLDECSSTSPHVS